MAIGVMAAWTVAVVTAQRPPLGPGEAKDEFPVFSQEELLRLLPPAPGRDKALRICASECHAADRVAAHSGGPEYWARIVQEMTLHGAQFTPDEEDEVVAYLADQLPAKVDINLLNERLLETRLQFTPEEAAAIVAWRSANGRLRSVEQLLGVPGVAVERVNAIRRRLIF
jgi:hypothetical protein